MLKQFKKRLLLIYMLTTGLLLAVILIFLFLLNIKQFSENNINNFENLVRRIKEEVTESISYSWLSKMEADNHLIISVSSNSIPIGFAGSWYPPTERKILMDKLKSFPSSDFFCRTD